MRAVEVDLRWVRGGKVVAQGAWGVDGDGRPTTPHTPVGFGPVSKSGPRSPYCAWSTRANWRSTPPWSGTLPWFRLAADTRKVTAPTC